MWRGKSMNNNKPLLRRFLDDKNEGVRYSEE